MAPLLVREGTLTLDFSIRVTSVSITYDVSG